MNAIFHLSLSVSNLARSRAFYEEYLSAKCGRTNPDWIDLWISGVQLTIYERPGYERPGLAPPSPYMEGFHFGVTIDWTAWRQFSQKLLEQKAPFVAAPHIDDQRGTAKILLKDPDGYGVEIKAYRQPTEVLGPNAALLT